MAVIIEEVTAEAIKPVAPVKVAQPPMEVPGDTSADSRKLLAALRRAEARKERLRAD